VDIAEKYLRAAAAAGIIYHGPNLAQIRSERERLLREQAEKEDMQFERAMTYACQMMQKRLYSTTAKETNLPKIPTVKRLKDRTWQEITWSFTSRVM